MHLTDPHTRTLAHPHIHVGVPGARRRAAYGAPVGLHMLKLTAAPAELHNVCEVWMGVEWMSILFVFLLDLLTETILI